MSDTQIPQSLRWVSYGIYAFLYAPILMVVAFSFNQARYSVRWQGFSLHWYGAMFRNGAALLAAQNTLVLAIVSTAISTLLGSLLGYGLYRYRFPGKRWVEMTMYFPVVVPDIVMAISLLLFYKVVRTYTGWFELGMVTTIVSHVTFQVAFVAIVVRGRLLALDPTTEEAARDLYANGWQTFRYVVLPQLIPGIVAGALLAFTLSVDDFVIAFFTSSPTSATLPVLIYSTVRRGVTTEINALSTLLFSVTAILVVGYTLINPKRSDE